MSRMLIGSLSLLLACSDDDATAGARDSSTRGTAAASDAAVQDGGGEMRVADASALDARVQDASAADARADTAPFIDRSCFSPLRPPTGVGLPSGAGCFCESTVMRDPYCLANGSGPPFLLSCGAGAWGVGADGNCSSFLGGGATQTCEQRSYAPVPASGSCPRGYAAVVASRGADGGIASPACCDSIELSFNECIREGYNVETLSGTATDLAWPCRDGHPALAFISGATEPQGCCE